MMPEKGGKWGGWQSGRGAGKGDAKAKGKGRQERGAQAKWERGGQNGRAKEKGKGKSLECWNCGSVGHPVRLCPSDPLNHTEADQDEKYWPQVDSEEERPEEEEPCNLCCMESTGSERKWNQAAIETLTGYWETISEEHAQPWQEVGRHAVD